MTNKIAQPDPLSAADLRQVFETAVCAVHHAVLPTPQHRTPIVQRRPATWSTEGTEKRALTDAARALARLWNIAPAR